MFKLACLTRLPLALAVMLPAAYAHAADYPTRPVRVIVPFVAGGGTDLLARFVTQRFTELLGQQFVVDNRGGAGSVLGTQILSKATPDGYTLGVMDTAFAINPAYAEKLPYDAERDFAFIAIIATSPSLIVTGKATQKNGFSANFPIPSTVAATCNTQ